MNIEMSNIPLIKGRINIRRYYGQVTSAVRAFLLRRAEAVTVNGKKITGQACAGRERYLADSMAQLQSTRFLR
jgi:hypothetical protein